jgi:hypothetical protein
MLRFPAGLHHLHGSKQAKVAGLLVRLAYTS